MATESSIEKLGSDVSSDDGTIQDMVLDSPIYYILGQFLETEKTNKNVANLLEDLVTEMRDLKLQLTRLADAATSLASSKQA